MNSAWLLLLLPVPIGLFILLAYWQRRRSQVRFIQETLATTDNSHNDSRVIASLSTLPDRIANLEPTIRCLLEQTRPPDEIVIAIPEFSLRQQKFYVIPEYLAKYSQVRILRCDRDWGPATKFIPVIQQELTTSGGDSLIMIVDDDRISPRD